MLIENFYYIYIFINYVCLFIRSCIQFRRFPKLSLFAFHSPMQLLFIQYILYINIQIVLGKIHHILDFKTTARFPKSLLHLNIVWFSLFNKNWVYLSQMYVIQYESTCWNFSTQFWQTSLRKHIMFLLSDLSLIRIRHH